MSDRPLSPQMLELLQNLRAADRPMIAVDAYPKHKASARQKLMYLKDRGYAEAAGHVRSEKLRGMFTLWVITDAGRAYLDNPPPKKTTCDDCNVNERLKYKRVCQRCTYLRQEKSKVARLRPDYVPRARGDTCNCKNPACNGLMCERETA